MIASARRHAASRPGPSSARITPRLADIASGFTTQGNVIPSSCGARGRRRSTRHVAGTGSPAALSAARARSLRRVNLAAEGALCASPRTAAARLAISTVASSVATTAVIRRSRCAEAIRSRTAPVSVRSSRIPSVGPGDQRVLSFARDEHPDAEIASRLQVGMDPVAAGRGDQQNPGRALRPIGIRRLPQPHPPPAMPHAPQVPEPPVAWNTLLNTNVEPVSRVTKSISTPWR